VFIDLNICIFLFCFSFELHFAYFVGNDRRFDVLGITRGTLVNLILVRGEAFDVMIFCLMFHTVFKNSAWPTPNFADKSARSSEFSRNCSDCKIRARPNLLTLVPHPFCMFVLISPPMIAKSSFMISRKHFFVDQSISEYQSIL
jgi:hypothetical protein